MSLIVVRAAGLVTVQDLGRPGRMHEALPPGGALVDELLVAANHGARNSDGVAAIEVLGVLVVRADADTEIATDTTALLLRAGDEMTIASGERRVAYLAVRGGVHAPLVLGGRGTMLSAGLGASIRAGDRIDASFDPDTRNKPAGNRLARGTMPEMNNPRPNRKDRIARGTESMMFVADLLGIDDEAPIRVIPGPDAFPPGALDALTSSPYRISPDSDRVGTRLVGPALTRLADADDSRPMVRGAIEVPRDGAPIVLGPEHPTTGGYPVIGVVASADLGRLFAVRLGGTVRFAVR